MIDLTRRGTQAFREWIESRAFRVHTHTDSQGHHALTSTPSWTPRPAD